MPIEKMMSQLRQAVRSFSATAKTAMLPATATFSEFLGMA